MPCNFAHCDIANGIARAAASQPCGLPAVTRTDEGRNSVLHLLPQRNIRRYANCAVYTPPRMCYFTCYRITNETPNNFCDRLIRLSAAHFQSQLSSGRVLLLTNDRDNASQAKNAGLQAMSMRSYVEAYLQQYPELMDLVALDDSYMQEHSTQHTYVPLHSPLYYTTL